MAQQLQATQQQNAALAAEVQRMQGIAELPQTLVTMAANQSALLEALQQRERSSTSLVDVKGIGKPQ
eukprot:7031167-Karenia_brevis.AAC.1